MVWELRCEQLWGGGHYSAYHHDYNNLHTYQQKHEYFCCQHLVLADTSFRQSDGV